MKYMIRYTNEDGNDFADSYTEFHMAAALYSDLYLEQRCRKLEFIVIRTNPLKGYGEMIDGNPAMIIGTEGPGLDVGKPPGVRDSALPALN